MTDKETIADLRAKLAAKTKCIEDMKREMGSDKTVVELFVDAEFRAEKAEAELVEARKKKRELELAFCNCEELERFGKHAPWCVVNKVLSGKPKGGE